MEVRLTGFLILQLVAFWSASGEKCQKRTAPNNYCRKECRTDSDCKKEKKCICDGDCGLSCIRQGMKCDDNVFGAPSQGRRTYQGRNFGNIVKYECDKGYTLSGTSELYCSGIGRWKPIEKSQPKCLRQCPKPPAIQNGKVTGTNFGPGKTVSVRCFPGYEVNGSRIIHCGDDLRWLQPFPRCQVLGCPPPELPEKAVFRSGKRDSYIYGDEVLLRCLPGYFSRKTMKLVCLGKRWTTREYKCYPKSCGSPPRIDHGYFQGRVFTFGKTVRYRCDKGYNLVGPRYRNCQANQRWSERDPICKIVTCGSVPDLPNGEFWGVGSEYGSLLTAKCQTGYMIEGSKEIRCQENGKWSDENLECKVIPKNCNSPPAAENILYEQFFVEHGKMVDFYCRSGFTQVSGKGWRCEDGKFIGESPVCTMDTRYIGCYSVRGSGLRSTIPAQSIKSFDQCITLCFSEGHAHAGFSNAGICLCGTHKTFRYGTIEKSGCTLTCRFDDRFTCGGVSTMSLFKTGCYDPKRPGYGDAVNKVYKNGERAEYHCNRGFELKNDGQLCKDYKWVGTVPRCERISCGTPDGDLFESVESENTRFGEKIKLSCIAGYEMKGNPTIWCQSDGKWSTLPKCKLSSLGKRSYIGCFVLSYGMDEKATLSDESKRERKSCLRLCKKRSYRFAGLLGRRCFCLRSILMSEKKSYCDGRVKVYAVGECNDPPYVQDGTWERIGLGVNSHVDYRCSEGYELTGEKRRTCLSSLKWDGTPPSCKAELCPRPPTKRNMILIAYGYTHGSQAEIKCNTGYVLDGPSVIKCLHKKWEDLTAVCLAPCRRDFSDSNGQWSYSSERTIHKSTAKLNCYKGYKVKGNAEYTCENGRWNSNGIVGRCERDVLFCPPLRKPNGGYVRLYHGQGLKKAVFTCFKGYTLQGTKQLICSGDKWNGDEPRCSQGVQASPFACPISKEDNAAKEVSDSAPSTKVKLFTCPPGKALSGSAVLICISGSSSAVIPQCDDTGCLGCQPNKRSFQTLCNDYDTVFVGWVINDQDEDGRFGIRTKFSPFKRSVPDRRLDFNGNWRLKMKKTGSCMCPKLKKLSKYLIFMNLGGKESDQIQVALPFDMEAKYISTLKRHCKKKSN